MLKRVSQALSTGAAPLPAGGRVAVFDPPAPPDLGDLDPARIDVITTSARLSAACQARGFVVKSREDGDYSAALVFIDRARPLARLRLAEAVAAVPSGAPVLVDGQKTDGIETALKDCRERVDIHDSYVKSHGRLFWFAARRAFSDWAQIAEDWPMVEGYRTGPGVFSADGIDPGSALLAATLPPLKGIGADLGAGWGYLSSRVLAASPAVEALHLVEEDQRALDAARRNLGDARAAFHWADATAWSAPKPLDFVVMNPPFHDGREAAPELGRAFIAAAQRMLARHGTLWMVANRHLPYEATLDSLFATVTERVARIGFKVIEASGPKTGAEARNRA